MSPNKSNVHKLDGKLYHCHQAVVITFDVEYIVLVADIVDAVERFPDVGKASPLAPLHNGSPLLQSDL